jgi:hypothetical protein
VVTEFDQDQCQRLRATAGCGMIRSSFEKDDRRYCPRCKRLTVLQRVAPRLGPLEEERTYRCMACGTTEVERGV